MVTAVTVTNMRTWISRNPGCARGINKENKVIRISMGAYHIILGPAQRITSRMALRSFGA